MGSGEKGHHKVQKEGHTLSFMIRFHDSSKYWYNIVTKFGLKVQEHCLLQEDTSCRRKCVLHTWQWHQWRTPRNICAGSPLHLCHLCESCERVLLWDVVLGHRIWLVLGKSEVLLFIVHLRLHFLGRPESGFLSWWQTNPSCRLLYSISVVNACGFAFTSLLQQCKQYD